MPRKWTCPSSSTATGTESGWCRSVAAAAKRATNRTTAMCAEVNLCISQGLKLSWKNTVKSRVTPVSFLVPPCLNLFEWLHCGRTLLHAAHIPLCFEGKLNDRKSISGKHASDNQAHSVEQEEKHTAPMFQKARQNGAAMNFYVPSVCVCVCDKNRTFQLHICTSVLSCSHFPAKVLSWFTKQSRSVVTVCWVNAVKKCKYVPESKHVSSGRPR